MRARKTLLPVGRLPFWAQWGRPSLTILVVAALLCLGVANILARASFQEVEDGVLWVQRPDGVVVADIAEGTPAAAGELARGDVLLAIDDRPVEAVSDVVAALHAAEAGTSAATAAGPAISPSRLDTRCGSARITVFPPERRH